MSLLDESYTGTQSAFTMPGQAFFGASAPGALPGQGGSNGGVPDNASVAGGDPNNTTAVHQSQAQSGAKFGSMPAWNQPVFWAVISVFVGIFLLGHVAQLHVRGT